MYSQILIFFTNKTLHHIQKQPPKVFYKNVFLELSQNSQENTWARVSFIIKLQTTVSAYSALLKKNVC